jgi:hypothetical protein
MSGDYSRDSFDANKRFTRVLMQQGRVQLDSDWNEQVSIFWHLLQTFTRNLIGAYAGPENNCGFGVFAAGDFPLGQESHIGKEEQLRLQESITDAGDFLIGPGDYYVDGILCTNPDFFHFSKQSHGHHSLLLANKGFPYLIYIDAWERELFDIEDESIREVALGGADTAGRAQIVWQVKSLELPAGEGPLAGISDGESVRKQWRHILEHWQPNNRGRLRARARSVPDERDVTLSVPLPGYRHPQNQLYRVEIHQRGAVGQKEGPTFKWSRENGSVTFPITSMTDPVVTLTHVGRDDRAGLKVGDWVEVIDDDYTIQRRADPLRLVEKVDVSRREVTLSGQAASTTGTHANKHPFLRRWDHKAGDPRRGGLELRDGAAVIKEGDGEKSWLMLEDGVQIQFSAADSANHYRTGDYWLIPARTAIADVVWPRHGDQPGWLPPSGVVHHFAPMAIIGFNSSNKLQTLGDCRPKFSLRVEY